MKTLWSTTFSCEWAAHRAHDAFASLVERHVDLVYSAALRQVHGAVHRAEDLTQIVFINLARSAAAVSQRGSVIGWLYVATHHAAANLKRAEARRQAREREAQTLHEILSETSSSATEQWDRVRSVLDDAMLTLAEGHREALLLRFFKHQSFAQIGQAMNWSEDASRMCVDRAGRPRGVDHGCRARVCDGEWPSDRKPRNFYE